MPVINKEVMIHASPEVIYEYLYKPGNLSQIWPSLIELKNRKTPLAVGCSYRWMYKMSGMFFTGKGECVDLAADHWYTVKNTGAIDSLITWTLRAKNNKTRITFTNDYKVPEPLLAQMSENIINKMNEKETELILENLRARFEIE